MQHPQRACRGLVGDSKLDPMANMMILPFLKSAAVVLAKRAIVGVMN